MKREQIALQKAQAVERITQAAGKMQLELPELGTTIPRNPEMAILQTAELWATLAVLYEAVAELRRR